MISIIIPTLNVESTIVNAIESILVQSYKNYDIYIVDGMSTDRTIEIIKRYAMLHDNIRYITQRDKGIYDAMNFGISKAKGDIIYFLGADDQLIDKNMLLSVSNIFKSKSLDVLYGSVIRDSYEKPYNGKFELTDIFRRNICHQAIFVRKSVFDLVGNFDINYHVFADWEHNMRWFLNKDIKKQYLDLAIANFAEGGYSFKHKDSKFYADRDKIFIELIRKNYNLLVYLWLKSTVDTDFNFGKKLLKKLKYYKRRLKPSN